MGHLNDAQPLSVLELHSEVKNIRQKDLCFVSDLLTTFIVTGLKITEKITNFLHQGSYRS